VNDLLYQTTRLIIRFVLSGLLCTGPILADSLLISGINYSPVTDARLLQPEAENWLQWRHSYAGWGYSPLNKITADNVAGLTVAWTYSTGAKGAHEAAPIINNGFMYVSTPENQVIALDAINGYELWRYKRTLPRDHFAMHPTNRGVALYDDKVYYSGLDTCAIALDAVSGEKVWENCLADWRLGFHMTLAPLAIDGKILFGVSGAEFGVRCFLVALDAETGKELWRTYTIPEPGQPGGETWPDKTWQTGGGSIWITGTYDPKMKLAYYGVGNAAPWMPEMRKGDNLYTNSVLAIDPETGNIKGHHQYHWNGGWDWDEVTPPLLIDLKDSDGKMKKGLVHAGRNGYLWWLERKQDSIQFIDAKAFVTQNVFSHIDPLSVRPEYHTDKIPGVDKTVTFCPSIWGGKDWPPEAYNPETGLLYIPAHENLCSELTGKAVEYEAGEEFIGVDFEALLKMIRFQGGDGMGRDIHIGEIQAWDVNQRKRVWTYKMDAMNWGPILTTAGNLVFSGGSNDRAFRALNAATGELLWETRLNSGVMGIPVSFMVDDVQYIAVQAGWGLAGELMQATFDLVRKEKTYVPTDGAIWVFALRK
jgi:alcohol dehydrogenase (cytochrome c)